MTWSAEMDEILLDAFVAEDEKGNRHDGTWTSTAFDNIVKECVEKFGHVIDKENVKNRQRTLKMNFAACYDAFHGHSGFAWNPESQLFEADQRAKGKGAINAKEKSRQWREEENVDLTNSSIHEVESPDICVEPNSNSPTYASSQKNSNVSAKVTVLKRKAESNDFQVRKMALAEKQIEVINLGITGVADTLKEGNAIAKEGLLIAERKVALAEKSRPRIYSEEELVVELQNIDVPSTLFVDVVLYFLKNPVEMRAFFALPSPMRLEMIYKLVFDTNKGADI
ncbi:hypothetical protein Salat_1060700 [Sesamum alatum]|uniref:Myb/SANT-like domain-containing protein n=1 Tax=Sesamum alatum TaxID=300844 RepID=A0AAE1YMK6_9LAMI|nr:hypothetical protein Salat_1060700 [Sesamum alatum]